MSSVDKINPFLQQLQAPKITGVNPVEGKKPSEAGGIGARGIGAQGQSPFDQDMADFRSRLPKNNGTGELIPASNSKLDLLG